MKELLGSKKAKSILIELDKKFDERNEVITFVSVNFLYRLYF